MEESLRMLDLKIFLAVDRTVHQMQLGNFTEFLSNPWAYMPLYAALVTIFLTTTENTRRNSWAAFFSIGCWFIAMQLSDLLAAFLLKQPSPNAWISLAGKGDLPAEVYSMPDWFSSAWMAYLIFSFMHLPIGKRWGRTLTASLLLPIPLLARIADGDAFPSHVLLSLLTAILVAVLFHVFFKSFQSVVLREEA